MVTKKLTGQFDYSGLTIKILSGLFVAFAGWSATEYSARQESEMKQEVAIGKLQAESQALREQVERLEDDLDEMFSFFMRY